MYRTILNIHVKPSAGKNEIVEMRPKYIRIKFSAIPENSKANADVDKVFINNPWNR